MFYKIGVYEISGVEVFQATFPGLASEYEVNKLSEKIEAVKVSALDLTKDFEIKLYALPVDDITSIDTEAKILKNQQKVFSKVISANWLETIYSELYDSYALFDVEEKE